VPETALVPAVELHIQEEYTELKEKPRQDRDTREEEPYSVENPTTTVEPFRAYPPPQDLRCLSGLTPAPDEDPWTGPDARKEDP